VVFLFVFFYCCWQVRSFLVYFIVVDKLEAFLFILLLLTS
jgi:hypothetical protein